MEGEENQRQDRHKYFLCNKAEVAQLVEQPIRNRQVGGSSPPLGSNILRVLKDFPFSIDDLWAGRCKVVASFRLELNSKSVHCGGLRG